MNTDSQAERSIDYQALKIDMPNALKAMINNSFGIIPMNWPVDQMVSCNPFWGNEHQTFQQMLEKINTIYNEQAINVNFTESNRQSLKWLMAYFDQGQASMPMPYKSEGLFSCFLKLARFDNHLSSSRNFQWLLDLPAEPLDAILSLFQKTNLDYKYWAEFIQISLSSLPGWSGYMKYLTEWQNHNDELLEQFAALRITLIFLLEEATINFTKVKEPQNFFSMLASEKQYHQDLRKKLTKQTIHQPQQAQVQALFCIDCRSEKPRRFFEQEANFQTFGVAGFFGLPMAVQEQAGHTTARCPIIVQPAVKCTTSLVKIKWRQCAKNIVIGYKKIHKALKYQIISPFALAEALGIVFALQMIIKSLVPKNILVNIYQFFKLQPEQYDYQLLTNNGNAIDLTTQVDFAGGLLKSINLTEKFAKKILVFGHGATTQNNPYETTLNCGACNGYAGGANAQVLVKLLNDPEVRAELRHRHISIPDETKFYAGVHDTTQDCLSLGQADKDIQLVLSKYNRTKHQQQAQAHNWSAVRPEWGLANNNALIIAPRTLTQNLDLQTRAFLHDYHWQADEDLSILQGILLGPLIVAYWNNMQYFFSTAANKYFGSGNKVTHNIVGNFGVMQGNGSDLMIGLPLQSVNLTNSQAYHQAGRLVVVIQAPQESVDQILDAHQQIKNLVVNGWIHLWVIDEQQRTFQRCTHGSWQPIS